ncbi:HEAT repeat domain-containing protein, partial [Methanocalculus sp.]|uniref:HEAT repeat domain-containing protein n=1 Tax=Methanocalculus sp. TaxID=2004547 RepID=UPI00272206EC
MGFFKGLKSRLGSGGQKVEEEVQEEVHLPRLSLDDTLLNPDPEVRLHAISAIGEIGPAAVPLLINGLQDESWRVRRGAATGLVRIGQPSIVPLINCFEGARTDVRREVVRALTLIGDRAFPTLVSALESPSPEIRSGVAATIGMMEGQKRFEPLEKALKDDDPDVRTAAALAFGYLPDDKAIPTLLTLLGDEVESVRNASIDACTRLGISAVAPLIKALTEGNAKIRPRIEEVIIRIGSPARADLITLLQHQDPEMRRSAV